MIDSSRASYVIGHYRHAEKEATGNYVKAACAYAGAVASDKEWRRLNPDHIAQREANEALEMHKFVVDRFVGLTEEGKQKKGKGE